MSNDSDFDLTKIESVFGVITNEDDCHIVTNELGISPSRYRQKGEQHRSEFSSNTIIAQYGIWEISKTTVGENLDLSEHIKYFKSILSEKFEAIEKLSKHYKFVCVFYILVTTEDTVGGFELNDEEISFIKKISNRFIFRFSANLQLADFIKP